MEVKIHKKIVLCKFFQWKNCSLKLTFFLAFVRLFAHRQVSLPACLFVYYGSLYLSVVVYYVRLFSIYLHVKNILFERKFHVDKL